MKYSPILLATAALLTALGCGGSDQLVVQGDVAVGPASVSFPPDTTLVRGTIPRDGLAAGTCSIDTSVTPPTFAVSVYGDQTAAAPMVRSLTIRDDQVTANIGGDTFTGTLGVTCTIDTLYVDDRRGEFVGADIDCAVSNGTDTVQATGELLFDGC